MAEQKRRNLALAKKPGFREPQASSAASLLVVRAHLGPAGDGNPQGGRIGHQTGRWPPVALLQGAPPLPPLQHHTHTGSCKIYALIT